MKNSERARRLLEAELGSPLPTAEAELSKVIQDIRITRPDLIPLTNQLHEPPDLPLPEEAEATKAARREQRQATVRTLFYSPAPSGEPALNKRKVLGVMTALLVFTLPLTLIAQQLRGTAAASPPAQPLQVAQSVQAAPEVIPLMPGEPLASAQGEPLPLWPEEEWETPAPITTAPTSPTPTPATPIQPPVTTTPPITTGGQRLPPTPGAVNPAIVGAPPQWGTAQPAPTSAAAPPQPLLRYDRQPQAALPLTAFRVEPFGVKPQGNPQPRPPIAVYTAPPRAAALSLTPHQVVAERASPTAFAAQRQAPATLSMVAPARAEPFGPAPPALRLAEGSGVEGANPFGLTVAPARPSEPATTPLSWVAPPTPEAAPVTVFARPPVAEAAPAAAAPVPTGPVPTGAPAAPADRTVVQLARPGDRIPAQLTTGIALVDGATAPVAAETPAGGNWCPAAPCPAVVWLGQAALDENNRVSISFTQAIVAGEVRPVSGIALGLDHLPGLPANLRDATPTAALDLLRAAAGGVSDYVQALINRRQVVIVDGQQIVTDLGPPPLGQVVGGRVAELFQLPTGQTAVMRVAEVPFATALQVFYGVGSNR